MFVLFVIQLDDLLVSLAGDSSALARWETLGSGLVAALRRITPLQLSLYGAPAVGFLLLLAVLSFYQKRARLVLDSRYLYYDCGAPNVGRWLNWRLELDALRNGSVEWRLEGPLVNANPLIRLRLRWNGGPSAGLRPAHWRLSGGQIDACDARPYSVAGWANWRSSKKNQSIALQMYEALPLIRALRERGIPVPIPDGRLGGVADMDLMAYPRTRTMVRAFFACIVASLALCMAAYRQHYFSPPAEWMWVVAGCCAGLAAMGWMWGEDVPASRGLATRTDLRWAQLVVALTLGIAVMLCAPSVPLLWSLAAAEPRDVRFIVTTAGESGPRVVLLPLGDSDIPPIYPPRYQERFWKSLPSAQVMALKVRKGLAARWWQFDSSVIDTQWEAEHAE